MISSYLMANNWYTKFFFLDSTPKFHNSQQKSVMNPYVILVICSRLIDNTTKKEGRFLWEKCPITDWKTYCPNFSVFSWERARAWKYVPFYAFRVCQFLEFANRHAENDLQALIHEFLERLKTKENVNDGLVRQAQDAIQLYPYHYKDGIRYRGIRFGDQRTKALCPRQQTSWLTWSASSGWDTIHTAQGKPTLTGQGDFLITCPRIKRRMLLSMMGWM